ncbi:hypothetical protein DY000_02006589 [Brassica cretica]|uniref:Uncharacterized protein n=1 Tax=Brassica cretica TaxID=69181 RepID=A0ABQ7BV56_BRACR|nr:hypothetical protein DY000_02006589 [Brassica cretica]
MQGSEPELLSTGTWRPVSCLEAGFLPEAWMIFPNQFPLISRFRPRIRGITCALKSTGDAHFQQASPGQDITLVILLSLVLLRSGPRSNLEENKFAPDRSGSSRCFQVLDLLRDDLARFKTLVAFYWMSRLIHGARGLKPGPCLNLEESRFPRDRQGSNGYSQACVWFRLIDLGRFRLLTLYVDWTARLIVLAGEDHLYLLKSAVCDLLPRSEAGILDLGFALQTYTLTLGWRTSVIGSNRVKPAIFLIPSSGGTRPFVEASRPILCRTTLRWTTLDVDWMWAVVEIAPVASVEPFGIPSRSI